jgi:anti-sigma B factor antagonist
MTDRSSSNRPAGVATPASRFTLAGEIDAAAAPEVIAALGEHAATTSGTIVVDCSELTFIDASGLRLLSKADRALERKGRRVVVVNVSPRCRRVFELAGLGAAFGLRA